MPKGVIIPQRLAAQFCRMNKSAVCFSCPVEERTNQPSGRKVNKAVSLVRSIEPNMVIVSRRLGHAQVSTTANIYAHVIASADEKAAQITEKFADIIVPNQKKKGATA